MKKRVLVFVLLLVTISSYGGDHKKQNSFHSTVKFGVEAGLNFTTLIYQSPNSPISFALLWHAGIYGCVSLSKKVSFQPEILYSVKGNRISIGSNESYTNKLNYFEIPLQINEELGKKMVLLDGIYLGVLTNTSNSLQTTVYSNATPYNSTLGLNTLDVGGIIGIGYHYDNGFNYGVRCSAGFTSVSKKNLNIVPMTNLVISLYCGWTFK